MESLDINQIHVSFEEYMKNMDKIEKVAEQHPLNRSWPSVSEIDFMMEQLKKQPDWIWFCIYIHDYNKKPTTNEEHYSKNTLSKLIHAILVIDDDEEEAAADNETNPV